MGGVLICVPHAGGVASDYTPWRTRFERRVLGVTLPGREKLFAVPFLETVEAMASFVVETLRADLGDDVALWGHSLGGLVAFETARLLEREGRGVTLLAVGGCAAPSARQERPTLHTLPDRDLVTELARMGGMASEILAEPELLALLTPRLRADLRAAETYRAHASRIRAPILALGGERDTDVQRGSLDAWESHTHGWCRTAMLPGDHFFVRESVGMVVAQLHEALKHAADPASRSA